MKNIDKKSFFLGIAISVTTIALCGSAYAASYKKTATLSYDNIRITLDGSSLTPRDAKGNAVEPFIIDGTTYLPVRAVASALGLGVGWDQNSKTVMLTSDGSTPRLPDSPAVSTTTPSAAPTTGEKNALATAKNYLSIMPFSHSGLKKQLLYEGYTEKEASYGADNCGADWFEQAAKSGKKYLELMPFSRDGLIKQLEYEGFTHEQAEYGASANGLGN